MVSFVDDAEVSDVVDGHRHRATPSGRLGGVPEGSVGRVERPGRMQATTRLTSLDNEKAPPVGVRGAFASVSGANATCAHAYRWSA